MFVSAPTEHEARLRQLTEIFLEENTHLNLSALRTEETCWTGNILDSLSFLELLPSLSLKGSAHILDIGTGGGFPLLPLAVCLPEYSFTGLDATRKKIEAVGRIAGKMSLSNVSLVCGRAEEKGHDARYREKFDIVTSRAVAPLSSLLEYCSPFARRGGYVVLWKSLRIEQEMKESLLARANLSCHLEKQFEYTLEGDWGTRQLLVFAKTSRLSSAYPREVGVPTKDPIR